MSIQVHRHRQRGLTVILACLRLTSVAETTTSPPALMARFGH